MKNIITLLLSLCLLTLPTLLFAQSSGNNMFFDDGNQDHIIIADQPQYNFGPNEDFSFEAWVYPDKNGIRHGIISKYDPGSAGFRFSITSSRDLELELFTTGQGSKLIATSGSLISRNEWNHVAFTCERATAARIYVDGVEVAAADITPYQTEDFSNGEDVLLGVHDFPGGNGFFSGNIDEVRLWNTNLSQNTIRDYMCLNVPASHPNQASLLSYYKLDQSSGSVADDEGNLSNVGNLANNMSNQWTRSGAPIGDEAAFFYGLTGTGSLTIPDLGTITISNPSSAVSASDFGIHIYHVDEDIFSSSFDNEPANHLFLTDAGYFGIFTTDDNSSVKYDLAFDYTNNPDINGSSDENSTVLLTRDARETIDWGIANSFLQLDQQNNTIEISIDNPNEKVTEYAFSNNQAAYFNELSGPGKAIKFNGTDNYIELEPTLGDFFNSFYVSMWVKTDASSRNTHIISREKGNLASRWYMAVDNLGRLEARVQNGSNVLNTTSSVNIDDNEWHHIAMMRYYLSPANRLEVYVDGVLRGSDVESGSSSDINVNLGSTYPFKIGASTDNSDNPTNFFSGTIDEVVISRSINTAQRESIIRDLMCQKLTAYKQHSNLQAYFRFDDDENAYSITELGSTGNYHSTLEGTTSGAIVESGAALGDTSAFVYKFSGFGSSINVDLADGDTMTTTSTSVSINDGIHIYKVRSAPNVTTPPTGTSGMDDSRYFGFFPVGNSINYKPEYLYGGNTDVDLSKEADFVFAERTSAAQANWAAQTNVVRNTTTDELSFSNDITDRSEITVAYGTSPPADPSDLFTASIDNKVALTWSDNSSDETGFTIERSAGSSTNFLPLTSVPANTTSYTDNTVTSGQLYFYRIRAQNAAGFSGTI